MATAAATGANGAVHQVLVAAAAAAAATPCVGGVYSSLVQHKTPTSQLLLIQLLASLAVAAATAAAVVPSDGGVQSSLAQHVPCC